LWRPCRGGAIGSLRRWKEWGPARGKVKRPGPKRLFRGGVVGSWAWQFWSAHRCCWSERVCSSTSGKMRRHRQSSERSRVSRLTKGYRLKRRGHRPAGSWLTARIAEGNSIFGCSRSAAARRVASDQDYDLWQSLLTGWPLDCLRSDEKPFQPCRIKPLRNSGG
jgi:hypothetical protein